MTGPPSPAAVTAVVAYGLVQLALLAFSIHRLVMVVTPWRRRARVSTDPPPARVDGPVPVVTVQLPIYDERHVVERVIDAAAALRWPADRLEIQVLDDSTDDTTARAECAVARHRTRGVDIVLLHRARRDGWKAGALAAGLARARGELIAVFDADFVPAPDVLERLVPHFADPAVGMVQARWTHLDRDASALTAGQAVMLDAHFLIEHPARMQAGRFFNFNGTAGVWRRAAIESAGGWSADTLTEDLDLSYRAQLAGWRFVFAGEVEVPAELPAEIGALRSQQRRWTQGAIQTARKLLPRLLRAGLPKHVVAEAIVHLTGNVIYPLMLASGLLLPLALAALAQPGWPRLASPAAAVLSGAALLLGLAPVVLFLVAGQLRAGTPRRRLALDVVRGILLAAGLSLTNTVAVLRGLGPAHRGWERTPKRGDGADEARAGERYRPRPSRLGAGELVLALAFLGIAAAEAAARRWTGAIFPATLAAGLGALGIGSLAAIRRDRADATTG